MKKNRFKNIAGLTLLEMLIGVVISSIMMGAIYTTYTVVNNSYSQVTERAKISRSGRDIVEMMMRDIRMAGFKYILGNNTLGFPKRSYLEFVGGNTTIAESHDPIIIEKGDSALGPSEGSYNKIEIQGHPDEAMEKVLCLQNPVEQIPYPLCDHEFFVQHNILGNHLPKYRCQSLLVETSF